MSRIVRVAAAQLGPSGTKSENAERMIGLLERAAKQGAQIVAFPELSLTPYFCIRNERGYEQYFEPVDNEHLRSVARRAGQLGVATVIPFAERDGIQLFNSCAVSDATGRLVGRYRKIHIPGAFPFQDRGALVFEKLYFTPGNLGYPVFDLGFARIGVQICYERNFPEGYRILAMRGAEIVFTPTNLMRIGSVWHSGTWELVLRARAYENGIFVVGVNKAGREWDLDYVGDSLVARPTDGEVIARTEAATDDVLVVECDLDEIAEARRRLPFMRDRQPLTYGPLLERE
ncbi:MAG TPA: nitrilase-related carbon-nitrogen hydrolase [Candidatus Limnocylindria bacterium]|nr:nitrilase-related carbon-nitrogen hydrolase [Candidatus Limnocylindria bacterium]